MSTEKQIQSLASWFAQAPFAIVAFSGGVDSSLVAFLARHFQGPERMLAAISASPSLKISELDDGKGFCLLHDIPLQVVHTGELQNPDYAENPSNRCYYCKHTLYEELTALARSVGDCWILNGTNTDDQGDYRPGLQAADEFSVRSPLVECGLNKEDVRTLARHFELRCWNKPASPCLSSRIPYGQAVTLEKLKQIESGEDFLNALGFPIVRLRHYGDCAIIEVPPDRIEALQALSTELTAKMCELGFHETRIDAEGFSSGKLNRALASKGLTPLTILNV